jgi:hypothetical protein
MIQIEKFAQNHTANSGEFLDHHTKVLRKSGGSLRQALYGRQRGVRKPVVLPARSSGPSGSRKPEMVPPRGLAE